MVDRKDAGKLGDWIVFLIASACLVTFMAVTIGATLVFNQIDRAVARGWIPHALTFVVAFCVLASWLPPTRLSRSLRVAVLLPAVHAIVLALAWPTWRQLSRFVSDRSTASALATEFPIALAATATIAVFITFACVAARRRTGEWLHGFIMLALCELLLVGLWIPISCSLWPGGAGHWWTYSDPVLADVGPRVALCVGPPTLVALGFTALALRRPQLVLASRRAVVVVVLALVGFAMIIRANASARELVLYSNLVPLLLTGMVVAIAALIFFGIALAIGNHRGQRALCRHRRTEGVIVDDDDAPAFGFEITSWLRGPRIVQRPFAVSIPGATIPVRGAHLIAPLPAATTQLKVGETYAVLRPGDRVTIAGHASATGAPFRTSAAPVAGELFVAPSDRAGSAFAHVALAMWRPCVAYLLIVVAVAVPALAALAGT